MSTEKEIAAILIMKRAPSQNGLEWHLATLFRGLEAALTGLVFQNENC